MVRVELKGVSKYFGKVVAAEDVSFEVKEGELFFLLGPSGCGKTTILRIIAGFYQPDRGDVLFDGKSVLGVPAHKRGTGMVFQNYALWPHMTVYDNVAYGLKVRGVPMQERVSRVKEVLKIVKMEDYVMRYPNQLSGGQQQRVALARALVVEPEVLLLDEPLSNLDAKLRLETREEIKRIQRELKITTVYVTHDQEEALSMADRIAIMNLGKIEQIGSPNEVYNNPRNRFVAEFIGEANSFEGKIEGFLEEGKDRFLLIHTDYGLKIRARAGDEGLKEGLKVICMVRPERLDILSSPPKTSKNVIEAQVLAINYYGAAEHYRLQGPGKMELKATVFRPTGYGVREGEKAFVTFRPEDTMVFQA
ncbi:MAG: ABC transporter ATP-binding protein [Candidatus Bathyarchaeia archaeon]